MHHSCTRRSPTRQQPGSTSTSTPIWPLPPPVVSSDLGDGFLSSTQTSSSSGHHLSSVEISTVSVLTSCSVSSTKITSTVSLQISGCNPDLKAAQYRLTSAMRRSCSAVVGFAGLGTVCVDVGTSVSEELGGRMSPAAVACTIHGRPTSPIRDAEPLSERRYVDSRGRCALRAMLGGRFGSGVVGWLLN